MALYNKGIMPTLKSINMGGFGVINGDWAKTVSKYYRLADRAKERGITAIRFGNTPLEFGTSTAMAKNIVEYLVTILPRVIYGPTRNNPGMTLTDFQTTYTSYVLTMAGWAQSIGLPEFSLWNEIESKIDNSTLTKAILIQETKALAVQVRLVYGGKITIHSTGGQAMVDAWGTAGFTPGVDLDHIYVNFYGANQSDLTGFTVDAQRAFNYFGTLAKVGEFNLVTDSGTLSLTQEQQRIAITDRVNALLTIGYPIEDLFFFTLMKTDFSQKSALYYLEGGAREMHLSLLGGNQIVNNEVSSANFNTSTGRIDFGNHTEFHNPEFTFLHRIRPANPGTHRTLIGWSENGTPQFRVNQDNKLQLVKQNIGNIANTTVTLDTLKWYDVAVTYKSNGDWEFYLCITGAVPIKVAAGNSLQTWTYGTAKLYLGNVIGFAQAQRGYQKISKLFSRPLSYLEIIQSFTENSYNTIPDCVLCCPHNEGSGTTAYNTENGLNGTMTGVGFVNNVINPVIL